MPWVNILALLVFGAGLAILYLFIFNRPARRSLHDLAAGSCVILVSDAGAINLEPVRRAHLIAVAAIAVITLALPNVLTRVIPSETFAPLVEAFQAINKLPEVQYAQIQKGWSRTPDGLMTYIQVNAFLSDPGIDDAERAGRLARAALQFIPSSDVNVVQVNLIYGFDIGLASAFRSHAHANSPRDWAAR